jgi:hypothetical protein
MSIGRAYRRDVKVFQESGWSFVTSGGAEIDVGISKFLYVAGEAGAFYAKKDFESQIWRLPFVAVGGGLGLGVSAGGPITVQASLPCQPGGGFEIYRNPLRRSSSFGVGSFLGSFILVTGGGAVGFGGSISYLIFGAPSSVVNVLRTMGPIGLSASIDATILASQGGGALWGTAETSAASIGATAYVGEIITAVPAGPGETGN